MYSVVEFVIVLPPNNHAFVKLVTGCHDSAPAPSFTNILLAPPIVTGKV